MGSQPTGLSRFRAPIAWLGLALATFVGLLVLGRHLTFWQDEWAFIGAEPSGIASYLEPHNEHWSTVPLILYRAVLAIVGLHSYLPYMVILTLVHLIAVGGAFVLLARRLPGWAALLAVLPLFVLGSGYENLSWAFQIGFVASVAAGTWGLVALESDHRRRTAIAGTALLIVGLASSGMGIFFVVAAAVRLLVDPIFRRRSTWVIAPCVVFAAWYLAFGRHGASGTFAAPTTVLRFAARGLTFAAGRVAGFDLAGRLPMLGQIAGGAGLLLFVLVIARQAIGRRMAPLALGGVAAVATMYLVIGLTRADLPGDFATRSRYVYVAAFLLIPAAGDLIATISSKGRLRRAAAVGLIALAWLAVGANVLDFRSGSAIFKRNAGLTRAYLTVLAEHPETRWVDPVLPLGWPDIEQLEGFLEHYGSPLRDTLVPSNVVPSSQAQLERALVALAHGSFNVSVGRPPVTARSTTPTVLETGGTVATPAGSCLSVVSSAPEGWVTVAVPDGGWLVLDGPADGATASLGQAVRPARGSAIPLPHSPDGTWSIAVPHIGDGLPWQVRLDLPLPVTAHLCAISR